ncbi:MAG TPA: hypothetical protein VM098_08470 [Phycisphaerae bacterium]|nr:hypothetical protein [Phycisphaerae bacterium]
MLGVFTDYFRFWWWALAVPVILATWVFGGGVLLRRRVLQYRPTTQRDPSRFFVASLLAGLAGAAAGGVIFAMFNSLGRATETPLTTIGAVLGLLVMVAMAYLVIHAMVALNPKDTLRAFVFSAGPVLLLSAVVTLAAGLPAYLVVQTKLRRARAMDEMGLMRPRLEKYMEKTKTKTLPQRLDVLAEQGFTKPTVLRPSGPEGPPRYFYLPPASGKFEQHGNSLMICELRSHHGGRAVLFASGSPQWFAEQEFQELLSRPENQAFAAAFRAAGGK